MLQYQVFDLPLPVVALAVVVDAAAAAAHVDQITGHLADQMIGFGNVVGA